MDLDIGLISVGTHVKKLLKWGLIIGLSVLLLAILSLGGLVVYALNNPGDVDCHRYNYNSELNGGVKEFSGKKYIVNICGSGVDDRRFLGDKMDNVRLTISNDKGEIIAKRNYKVFWDGQPGHEPLVIEKDRIIYQDDKEQVDHSIDMPPTMWDWVRARLPIF